MVKKTSKRVAKTPKNEVLDSEISKPSTEIKNTAKVFSKESFKQRLGRKIEKFRRFKQTAPIIMTSPIDLVRCGLCNKVLRPKIDVQGSIVFPDTTSFFELRTVCRHCMNERNIPNITIQEMVTLATTEFPTTEAQEKLIVDDSDAHCIICGKVSKGFIYWNSLHRLPIKIKYCIEHFNEIRMAKLATVTEAVIPAGEVKDSNEAIHTVDPRKCEWFDKVGCPLDNTGECAHDCPAFKEVVEVD